MAMFDVFFLNMFDPETLHKLLSHVFLHRFRLKKNEILMRMYVFSIHPIKMNVTILFKRFLRHTLHETIMFVLCV